MFPFEIPEDLTALSAADFTALAEKVRKFAADTIADEAATAEILVATREAFGTI